MLLQTKIVGGRETGINEYPMMAGIINVPIQQVYCGGTIISPKHILTAAHCLNNLAVNDLGILVGDHDLTTGNLYIIINLVVVLVWRFYNKKFYFDFLSHYIFLNRRRDKCNETVPGGYLRNTSLVCFEQKGLRHSYHYNCRYNHLHEWSWSSLSAVPALFRQFWRFLRRCTGYVLLIYILDFLEILLLNR